MKLATVSIGVLAAAALMRGQTAPQRTMTTNPANAAVPKTAPPPAASPTPKAPAAPPDAAGALDSLTNSLQDLNAIRDGNLNRVQKDGCPPEVSARLADLRGKLHQYEAELSGEAPAKAAPSADKPGVDAQAIASDWFKRPQPDRADAASQPAVKPQPVSSEAKLLADVLPDAPAPAAKPRPAAQPRPELEAEVARLKAEIARLSGTCTALKK